MAGNSTNLDRMIRCFTEAAEAATDPVLKIKYGELALKFIEVKKPRKKRSDAGIDQEAKDKLSNIQKMLG